MKPSISIFILALARATTLLFLFTRVPSHLVVTASDSSFSSLHREGEALVQSQWWDGYAYNKSLIPYCHWYGITCNYIGSVTKIRLNGTYYTEKRLGDLSLSSFPNLVRLDLSSARLLGSIPTEIGNLPNLTHLNLSRNILSGPLPLSLGNLSQLVVLDLSVNSLNGSIPQELGNLKNDPSTDAYGLFLCRGDMNSTACRDCVQLAVKDAVKRCPVEKETMIWYDECQLRYSNRNFIGFPAEWPRVDLYNTTNIAKIQIIHLLHRVDLYNTQWVSS